ncbi:Coenzyme F420-dependent N5,N10-methylene tetrahydromethanopterin reductase-related flavin- dependent oxidoreductase [Gordonia sp. KTR9]|nr:Coenzyme F420-dependent N5,N10-methylene tetrahydromethanopterin reductase-related flavin- dependent oxidoreductase [Gordonia sp. KTR9]
MSPIPLSVLDLLPRVSGADSTAAVRNAIDLAQRAERFGYARYWFAEHHLNPGVVGSSPAVEIALVAGSTSTIRLGSAGVQFGHRTPLATVEEFGLVNALYPGRLDLGIGRSISRPAPRLEKAETSTATAEFLSKRGGVDHSEDLRTTNGLLLPRQPDLTAAYNSDAAAHLLGLLQQPGAYAPDYDEQISTVLALLDGTYVSPEGLPAHAAPGEGADVEVWILGGSSATVAGSRGLRFVASYHHSPTTVVDAVEAYRAAFRPSDDVPEPYVAVSVAR